MSTLRVNAIQNTSGVEQYLAKAWVNFNGTGVVAIRASGNVTSITDNGTGDYTVNFTNALADANYSPCVTCAATTTAYSQPYDMNSAYTARNTTSYRFNTVFSANTTGGYTGVDSANIYVAIFR